MIHADAALARRLEGFICREWRQLADIAATLWPEKDVATMEVGGGVALWLGDGGLVNVAAGMAMEGPIGETELRRVEDFYVRWGAPPMLATCPSPIPRCSPSSEARLAAHRVRERPGHGAPQRCRRHGRVGGQVAAADRSPVCATPAERAVFGRVAARGFSDDTAPGSAHVEFGT